MILTLTMNPSIDMAYPIDHLKIDDVNRVTEVSKSAGGKGLNVSRVIHQMGQDVLSTGMLGGNFGEFILNKLDKDNIKHKFFKIDSESRNSIAILHDGGNQTEILESGPTISTDESEKFIDFYKNLTNKNDLITMSGSLPKGLDQDYYTQLINIADESKVLLDTSGDSLKTSLKAQVKPYLIKPNEEELQDLVGQTINLDNDEEMQQILTNQIFEGISWIVVSLGSKGAFAKHDDKFYRVEIPKINVVNPVGSGDSTLGGLAIGIEKKLSDADILKYGMTLGLLNTMNSKTGYVEPSKFDEYHDKVVIKEV